MVAIYRTATIAISQRTKQQTTGRPAEEKSSQKPVTPFINRRLFGHFILNAEQIIEHVTPGDIENLPLINIKYPSRAGDGKNQPLIFSDAVIPLGRRLLNVVTHYSEPSGRSSLKVPWSLSAR